MSAIWNFFCFVQMTMNSWSHLKMVPPLFSFPCEQNLYQKVFYFNLMTFRNLNFDQWRQFIKKKYCTAYSGFMAQIHLCVNRDFGSFMDVNFRCHIWKWCAIFFHIPEQTFVGKFRKKIFNLIIFINLNFKQISGVNS